MSIEGDPARIDRFWRDVRRSRPDLPEAVPLAWAFGATAAHADELLSLVIAGIKTATASSVWDYEHSGEPLPLEGEYSILLDGGGEPRAVIVTTQLETVAFDEVTAEHAAAEGEGDLTLAAWRDIHERFWTHHSENPRGFAPDMPVLCERFELVAIEEPLAF